VSVSPPWSGMLFPWPNTIQAQNDGIANVNRKYFT
jgi:hypothetical protein